MNPDNPQDQQPQQSPIMPKAEQERRPVFDPTGRVESINPNEIKIADIRRHPFGLFVIYALTFLTVALIIGLIVPFMPSVFDVLGIGRLAADGLSALITVFVVSLAVIFVILATRVYRANQLILTNDNVTQVTQVTIFHRKVSEISMGNVEDVTANQAGIFQTVFNFGHLHIETAGEQNNYDFKYCPNPNAYAKAIQDARVKFLKTHGN